MKNVKANAKKSPVVDVIIQARMGSTRLPKKMLMPLGGKTLLEHVADATVSSEKVRNVIIATTTESEDDAIEELCGEKGYLCFRGSMDNVLGRYYEAAKQFGSSIIVRATGDNPLTDIEEMDRLIRIFIDKKLVYAGNHKRGLPLGTGTEVFTFEGLEEVHNNATREWEREHVTPHFYENVDKFPQEEIAPETPFGNVSNVRLTLDTQEDYDVLTKLEALACKLGRPFTSRTAVALLQEHPDIAFINTDIHQKTYKE
jgi:spore coat polysaccharide biosynthesis protein SpsF